MSLSFNRILFIIPLLLFLIFAGLMTIALLKIIDNNNQPTTLPSPLVGKPAPPLPPVPLDQTLTKRLDDFRGQPVLVNVMASWCLPCRAEIPALDALRDEIAIIAIAYKDKPEDTKQFLAQYGNPYQAIWQDPDGNYSLAWGIYGVPETFIIDDNGIIVLRHSGPILKSVIDDVIRPQLNQLSAGQNNG